MRNTYAVLRGASVLAIAGMLAVGATSMAASALAQTPKPQTQQPQPAARQAQAQTPPTVRKVVPTTKPTGARVAVPTNRQAAGRGPVVAAPAAAIEPVAFPIESAKPLVDQLVALGASPTDAAATITALEAKAVSQESVTSGRVVFGAAQAAGGKTIENLRLFGMSGVVADLARGDDGKFGGPGVTTVAAVQPAASAPATVGQPPRGGADLVRIDDVRPVGSTVPAAPRPAFDARPVVGGADVDRDDPRRWQANTAGVAPPSRAVVQSSIGVQRVRADRDSRTALTRAGLDSNSVRAAAAALAAVAPAGLNPATANMELVHGRTDDGQVRLVAASVYDGRQRGQAWWFAPRGQPDGFFDNNGARVGDGSMTMPVEGSRISSPFGPRRLWLRGGYAFHNGIDLEGKTGTPIVAAADGVVDHVGWYLNYGQTVRVVHTDSLTTSYHHMSRYAPGLRAGTKVRRGEVIGFVGSTGRSTGPHLHFCVWIDGAATDPAPYVNGGMGNLNGADMVAFREWQRWAQGIAGRNAPAASGDPTFRADRL